MKIMRYFPLIALAFLGFILYGLFKTSKFINKKVDSKTLLSQDSIVKQAADSMALSANSVMVDTLSVPNPVATVPVVSSIMAPSVKGDNSSKGTAVAPDYHSNAAKKVPVDAKSASSATNQVATSPTSSTASTGTKATVSTENSKKVTVETPQTEVSKQVQTRGIVKTPQSKTTSSTNPTTLAAKGDVPKSASIEVKKDASEASFHVIIGSYGQEANAKAKAAAFEQKNNKKATIIKQGGYFRVCADEFEFAQAASQYAQKLKEAGEDNIIVKF